MSRPKDLPAALQAWALANYSAGPSWGGTPQRAAPGAQFLTPGITLPAENENYLHGNAFDAVQGALNMGGQIPAMNWGAAVAPGLASAAVSGVWSDAEQAWYAITTSSNGIQHSFDYGKTWSSGTALTTLGVASDIAVDTAGNICIASVLAVQEGPFVSYGTNIVWTNHAGALGAVGNANHIVFEPTNALWCVIGNTIASSAWVYTSANRSTWTSRTIPGTWTTSGVGRCALGAGNGILVATYVNNSTSQFRTMRSADGGITWTNDQAVVQNAGISIVAGGNTSRPVWSPTDALWYVAIGQTSTRKTQVFSSPDGITWSTAATLLTNDCNFVQIQCIGSLLVAVNDDGRIFASKNQGANWFRCQITSTPSSNGSGSTMQGTTTFRAGGGGLMLFTAGNTAIPSLRFGLPLTAA